MYRPEIDGLRAIAVLAVVLYHVGIGPPAGYVGVDVFFVISGYLITGILLRQERIDLLDFYARRMRRLVPALMLVVGATLLFSRLFVPLDSIASSAAASMLFVANIYFHEVTRGYFHSATSQMPLLHLWSLGVEEQFYLLWPLLLAAMWRWRHRALLPLVAGLSLVSLAASELVGRHIAFYSMPTRFWELAAGGLIVMTPPLKRSLAGPGLVLLGLSLFMHADRFPGLTAMPAVLGTALIISTLHAGMPLGFAGKILRLRPMVFTGLISYSLYLWHWPLLAFESLLRVGMPSTVFRLGLAALAGVLAWLTYTYVETPFRRRAVDASNLKIVVTSVVLSAGLALGAAMHGRTFDALGVSLGKMLEPRSLVPPCHIQVRDELVGLPPASCNSIPGKDADIVLWGDSHANSWKPFVLKMAANMDLSVASFTLGGCPPALGYGVFREDCGKFNDWSLEHVKTHRPDTVILASRILYRMRRISEEYSSRFVMSDDEFERRKEIFAAGLRRTVDNIAPMVNRVILMGPLPQSRKDVALCRMLEQEAECAMSRREFDELAQESFVLLDGLARRHPNVEVIRVDDFFCNEDVCPIMIGGVPVFSDSDHLTRRIAESFADSYQVATPGSHGF